MISSVENPTIKRTRRLRKRAERLKRRAFIAEGHRAVGLAVRSANGPELLLHSPAASVRHRQILVDAEAAGARVVEVTPQVLKSLTSARTPPDLLAVVRMPERIPATSQTFLVLDRVHDPASVGTLLASAAAAGIRRAVAVRGTADPFGSTSVRVGAGAHCVMAIDESASMEETIAGHEGALVVLSDHGAPPWSLDLRDPLAFVVGNAGERQNAIPTSLPSGEDGIGAPMAVAAAVVMFEARRQREGKR